LLSSDGQRYHNNVVLRVGTGEIPKYMHNSPNKVPKI
jgi:hypothetical protein